MQIRIGTTCDPCTIGSVGERHTVRPTQLRIGRPGKEHHGPNSQASAIRFNVLLVSNANMEVTKYLPAFGWPAAIVEVGPQIQWLFGLCPGRRQATISTLGDQNWMPRNHAWLCSLACGQNLSVERSGANILGLVLLNQYLPLRLKTQNPWKHRPVR